MPARNPAVALSSITGLLVDLTGEVVRASQLSKGQPVQVETFTLPKMDAQFKYERGGDDTKSIVSALKALTTAVVYAGTKVSGKPADIISAFDTFEKKTTVKGTPLHSFIFFKVKDGNPELDGNGQPRKNSNEKIYPYSALVGLLKGNLKAIIQNEAARQALRNGYFFTESPVASEMEEIEEPV